MAACFASIADQHYSGDMFVLRFLFATIVYTVIDVGWNLSPVARNMYARFHEASGNDWSFGKPMETWGVVELVGLLVFLLLIGLGNSYLAIEPAIREQKLSRAMRNSFVLGCAAYATYIVPTFLAIANWPSILIPIDILIGGLLSLITSTIVASIAIARRKKQR